MAFHVCVYVVLWTRTGDYDRAPSIREQAVRRLYVCTLQGWDAHQPVARISEVGVQKKARCPHWIVLHASSPNLLTILSHFVWLGNPCDNPGCCCCCVPGTPYLTEDLHQNGCRRRCALFETADRCLSVSGKEEMPEILSYFQACK